MKCPGCGKELTSDKGPCPSCGGMVDGETIDYSLGRKRVSDVYDVHSADSDSAASDTFDDIDEQYASVMWLKLAMLVVLFPMVTVFCFLMGLVGERDEFFYWGTLFLILSVFSTAIWYRYFRGSERTKGSARATPTSRHTRRI